MKDSIGCKDVVTKTKKPSQSFKTEYGFETSPTGSHVTVPFLPNEETNNNGPHLKLEEFVSPSFKVGYNLWQSLRCILSKTMNNNHSILMIWNFYNAKQCYQFDRLHAGQYFNLIFLTDYCCCLSLSFEFTKTSHIDLVMV